MLRRLSLAGADWHRLVVRVLGRQLDFVTLFDSLLLLRRALLVHRRPPRVVVSVDFPTCAASNLKGSRRVPSRLRVALVGEA